MAVHVIIYMRKGPKAPLLLQLIINTCYMADLAGLIHFGLFHLLNERTKSNVCWCLELEDAPISKSRRFRRIENILNSTYFGIQSFKGERFHCIFLHKWDQPESFFKDGERMLIFLASSLQVCFERTRVTLLCYPWLLKSRERRPFAHLPSDISISTFAQCLLRQSDSLYTSAPSIYWIFLTLAAVAFAMPLNLPCRFRKLLDAASKFVPWFPFLVAKQENSGIRNM